MNDRAQSFTVGAAQGGAALAGAIRGAMAGRASWSQVKRMIAGRRVRVNGVLCLDEARRLKAGDVVEVLAEPHRPPPGADDVRIVYRDEHLAVVDKPAGMMSQRRPEERAWPEHRKARQPTLEEALARKLHLRRLYAVHRLDRDTSGLMLWALTPEAQAKLIRQFAKHAVERVYLAVVHGHLKGARTIESHLVRDRGDGLRGSGEAGAAGAERAVTHVRALERVGPYTLVECRLETGRTHQVRIHLAEAGHRLCGEKIYTHAPGEPPRADDSGAPRHALHSAEARFAHPITGAAMRFESPLPPDLARWLDGLRKDAARDAGRQRPG